MLAPFMRGGVRRRTTPKVFQRGLSLSRAVPTSGTAPSGSGTIYSGRSAQFRGPLGPRCRSETGAPLSRAICPSGVRAEKGTIPTVGARAAAALRAAVPTGGQRSLASAPTSLAGVLAETGNIPLFDVRPFRCAVARHLSLRGTRREGNHPDGWGPRRRGSAGRRADRRSAFPCFRANFTGWGTRRDRKHSAVRRPPLSLRCRAAMPV